jgi:hypothetical protein
MASLQLWIISLEITYSKGEVLDPGSKFVKSFLIQKTTSPIAHFTLGVKANVQFKSSIPELKTAPTALH